MPEHVPGPDLSTEVSDYSALRPPKKPELEKLEPTPISREVAAEVGAVVVSNSVDTSPDLSTEVSDNRALSPDKPETPVTAEESGTTVGEHDESITVADSAQVGTDQRSDLSDLDAAIPQGPGVIEQQDPGPSDRGDEIATKPERIKGEENGATSSEQESKPTDERTVDLAFLIITDPGNINNEFAPELVQIVKEYSGDGRLDITKAREAALKELEGRFGEDRVGECLEVLENASNDPHETRSVGQIVAEYLNHPDAQTSQDPSPSDRGDESAIKPERIEEGGNDVASSEQVADQENREHTDDMHDSEIGAASSAPESEESEQAVVVQGEARDDVEIPDDDSTGTIDDTHNSDNHEAEPNGDIKTGVYTPEQVIPLSKELTGMDAESIENIDPNSDLGKFVTQFISEKANIRQVNPGQIRAIAFYLLQRAEYLADVYGDPSSQHDKRNTAVARVIDISDGSSWLDRHNGRWPEIGPIKDEIDYERYKNFVPGLNFTFPTRELTPISREEWIEGKRYTHLNGAKF